jgi:hypothetical protein
VPADIQGETDMRAACSGHMVYIRGGTYGIEGESSEENSTNRTDGKMRGPGRRALQVTQSRRSHNMCTDDS